MSKTVILLLALALVWLTAWGIAGVAMHGAGSEKLAQVEHLSTPATQLERGADVRVEGTIVPVAPVTAPIGKQPCIAALTNISVVGHYRDIHDRTVADSSHVATLRVGPPLIEIAVGDRHIALPIERWAPVAEKIETFPELPQGLGVTPQQIDAAKANLRGSFSGFSISESTLEGGVHVFIAGRIDTSDGPLRLGPDPVLGRVEVYPGTHQAFLAQMRGSGAGLRTAGWILGAGIGPLPLEILGLVLLRRRRKSAHPGS